MTRFLFVSLFIILVRRFLKFKWRRAYEERLTQCASNSNFAHKELSDYLYPPPFFSFYLRINQFSIPLSCGILEPDPNIIIRLTDLHFTDCLVVYYTALPTKARRPAPTVYIFYRNLAHISHHPRALPMAVRVCL